MDSTDYFDKRDSKSKGKKGLGAEWNNLKKVWMNQQPKEKLENKEGTPEPKKKGH